jgi:TonB family protein
MSMKKIIFILICWSIQLMAFGQNSTDSIYITPTEIATFVGGDSACKSFIVNNIKMPDDAVKMNLEGAAIVRFVVESNGALSSVEIKKGVIKTVNDEIIRVVKTMPDWIPAKENNKPVRSMVEIPIAIRQFDYMKFDSLIEYLDSNYKVVNQDISTCYKVIRKGETSFEVSYYLKNGTLTLAYQCKTLKPEVKHGQYVEYYDKNQVELEGNYLNDKKEGVFITYHKNGKVKLKYKYKNNLLDGFSYLYFLMDSTKAEETLYNENKIVQSRFMNIDSFGNLLSKFEGPTDYLASMPEYPGGDKARIKFLSKNLKYPELAREKDIEGSVYVEFIVERDGSLSNIKVKRGIGGGCNEESIRVIKLMPKWIPGKQDGEEVRVSFLIPIKFILH